MAEPILTPEEKIFYYGLQSNYEAIETKDPNKLYFCTDTKRIYKGDIEVTETVEFMYSKPANPIPGKIYFFVYSGTTEVYNGESWIVVSYPIVTSDEIYSSPLTAGSTTVQFQLPPGNTSVNFFTKNNVEYINSLVVGNNIELTYTAQAVDDIVYMKVYENSKFSSILVTSFFLDNLTATGNLIFARGEKFDSTGITLVGTMGSDTIDLTPYLKTKPANGKVLNTSGTIPVKVTYGVMETTLNITVINNFDEIEVTTNPTKTTYVTGDKLDVSGIVVTAYANNKSISKDVTKNCKFVPKNGTTLMSTTNSVTVKFMDLTTSFSITVENPPEHMEDASWDMIKSLAESGNIGTYYPVGSTKTVSIPNVGTFTMEVANINDGKGSAGNYYPAGTVDLVSRELIYPFQKINVAQTNAGGWEACDARRYLNSTVYNALPEALKSAIVPKTHLYNVGGSVNENVEVTDNIWLPTLYECGFEAQTSGTFRFYEYASFNQHYSIFTTDESRIKRLYHNGMVWEWFTGTCPISTDSEYYYKRWGDINRSGTLSYVYPSGGGGSQATVPICFRIGKSN